MAGISIDEEKNSKTEYVSRESETVVWKQYQDGLNFQRSMGFAADFPVNEAFKCGKQWPEATERTKAMPRPVFNIVSMFVANKKSNVLNNGVKMVFRSAETGDDLSEGKNAGERAKKAGEGAKKYTDYAEKLWYELDQDELNDSMVEDAATNGTGILHYYWDGGVCGGEIMPYSGSLRGEVIDPLNFFVSNPQETDIQKQEWIIISSRTSIDAVRKTAKLNGMSDEVLALIRPDRDTSAEGYDTATHEQEGRGKITVLTKYFRKNGAVYFTKTVKNATIIKETCLTPGFDEYLRSALKKHKKGRKNSGENEYFEADGEGRKEEGFEEYGLNEAEESLEPEREKSKEYGIFAPEWFDGMPKVIRRYPIVVFNWQKRKKCIFGRGEVEGIIPNQKAINFNIAMLLLSVQDTGWPKIIVKPGALQQKVTNKPGEILTDHYTSGDGIKYMQPSAFNGGVINLVDKIMDLSRSTSGVTEVATGEQISSNMAASAIIALQNEAKLPIDSIQKRFYRAIKEAGRIWEEFFKTYYSQARLVTVESAGKKRNVMEFTGTDYADVDFDLIVDVGASSTYSESLGQASLDKMYDKGDINVDQYVELSPDNIMPFKATLKKMREEAAIKEEEKQKKNNDGAKVQKNELPLLLKAQMQNAAKAGNTGPLPQIKRSAAPMPVFNAAKGR